MTITNDYSDLNFSIAQREKTIDLLEAAIGKNKTFEVCYIAPIFLASVASGCVEVIGRIAFIALEIIQLPCRLSLDCKGLKGALYHLICIVALDPLSALGSLVAHVIRAVSLLFACFFPTFTLKSWQFAEQIELIPFKASLAIADCIAPEKGIKIVGRELSPTNVLPFMSEEECLEIEHAKQSPGERKALEDQMLQAANAFLPLIEQAKQLYFANDPLPQAMLVPIETVESAKAFYETMKKHSSHYRYAPKNDLDRNFQIAEEHFLNLATSYFAFGTLPYRPY